MVIPVIIDERVHTAALREARSLGGEVPLPPHVLHAPLDDEATTWIDSIWDAMEGAIRRAYREGMDAARPLIERASALIAEMSIGIARRAEDVRAAIVVRLRTYLHGAIDAALASVRSVIIVGGRELQMKSVKVEQRVNLSGSLKASLEETCEFVARGEISLAAEYSL
jgi:hypothetical protein